MRIDSGQGAVHGASRPDGPRADRETERWSGNRDRRGDGDAVVVEEADDQRPDRDQDADAAQEPEEEGDPDRAAPPADPDPLPAPPGRPAEPQGRRLLRAL